MAEDDSQAPDVMPLGEKLSYSTLIERSAPAEMSTRSFQASNGSVHNSGTEIRIPLSVSANTFVDTSSIRLNFGVTASRNAPSGTLADDALLDGGALSLIREITIISSDGSIVDRVSSYNILANAMNNLTRDPDMATAFSQYDGYHGTPKNCVKLSFAAAGTTSTKHHFTTPLPYVGVFSLDRYLPLGYLAGSSLTVSLLLESPTTAMNITGGANRPDLVSFQLSDVNISMNCIHYNQSTSNSFQSLVQSIGGVQMASKAHGHFKLAATQVMDTSTQHSFQVPVRERSCNYLVTTLHDNARLVDSNSFSISGRVSRDIIEVNHSISGLSFPPVPITIGQQRQGELWTEISKALNIKTTCVDSSQIGDENGDGDVDARALYPRITGNVSGGTTTKSETAGCMFAIVQSFDIDAQNMLESGIDLSGQSANVVLNVRCGSTPSASSIVNSWVESTCIYTLTSSGTLVSSS